MVIPSKKKGWLLYWLTFLEIKNILLFLQGLNSSDFWLIGVKSIFYSYIYFSLFYLY